MDITIDNQFIFSYTHFHDTELLLLDTFLPIDDLLKIQKMRQSTIPVQITSGIDPSPDVDNHFQTVVFLWVALTLDFINQQQVKEAVPSFNLSDPSPKNTNNG